MSILTGPVALGLDRVCTDLEESWKKNSHSDEFWHVTRVI